jgi:2-polyprenyl-3-methyl-5-hydroxy-6-metoxy-1,4-benzoquinol methylase
MTPDNCEVLANHERYVERKALYKRFGYDIEQERAFIIEKARPISGRILEAGTGKGYFTLALAQEGIHFTSLDISEAEQKYALLNLMYYGLEQQVHFDIANAECLAYKAGSFDVIFTVNMVHHLSSARNVCDELIRVLAPSGKMVLSDFNGQGLLTIDKIHALEGRRHEVGAGTLADMMELLIERGFRVEQHQGVNQDTIIAYGRHS